MVRVNMFCYAVKEPDDRYKIICDLCKHNLVFRIGEKNSGRKVGDAGISALVKIYDKRHMDIQVIRYHKFRTKYGFITHTQIIEAYVFGDHVANIIDTIEKWLKHPRKEKTRTLFEYLLR